MIKKQSSEEEEMSFIDRAAQALGCPRLLIKNVLS